MPSNIDSFSTLAYVTSVVPTMGSSRVVARALAAPDITGQRVAEGGLRLRGRFKASLPGMPLVTVITVCLNARTTLEQTLLSVFGQTYRNVEYIVVDAASSDGTVELIGRYADAIDYFVSEPDQGLYHAMNKGLELASGEYILVLNSDDWYEPDCIRRLVGGLQASGLDFASALARRVDAEGKEIDVLPSMPYDDSLRFGMSLRHELMLVPAQIYEAVGPYDTAYRIIADFDFAIRLFNAGYAVHEIQAPLLNFRMTGVSNTNWTRLVSEHFVLLKSQFGQADQATLHELSDPRRYSAEIVDRALVDNEALAEFCESLTDYGYRRGLYAASRPPVLRQSVQPVVSIVVPCFNSATTLMRCLESMRAQSLRHLEVICIDDASRDDTPRLLAQIAASDTRVRVITHATNRGVAASRNHGLRATLGRYVYFVDADDELLPDALMRMVTAAETHHSDLVRGAFEKVSGSGVQIVGSPTGNEAAVGTLQSLPDLLRNTEGFWSYLYRKSFIRNARFAETLRMGEDSLFLICALVRASHITWITETVYRYHTSATSAMRNFDLHKYLNSIEWRERAWQILVDHDRRSIADWCAFDYWNPSYFNDMARFLAPDELGLVRQRMSGMLKATGYLRGRSNGVEPVRQALDAIFDESLVEPAVAEALETDSLRPTEPRLGSEQRRALVATLRIGVFSTQDKGGAATGSVRRVELLRAEGVNATLHTLTVSRKRDYLHPMVPADAQEPAWKRLKAIAIDPVMTNPAYRGMELFSMPRSVIDFTKHRKLFQSLGVVHLHWVVGILDYQNIGAMADAKPVVWTLADMAAFTGGCHYSEGCQEFERECKSCHLLPPGSPVAHENWKVKKAAYAKIQNLEIICPSRWMAERVSRSSLLGDRKINVIPNALPVHSFTPYNRLAARIRLGLPIDKRLILFGADSLANKRKGGDLLQGALARLAKQRELHDVEIMMYGHHRLELPLPVHSLGFLNGHEQLSLAYSAADLYAFPSREDNAPLTVAESLLCGTPVVAFPVGNVPELVTHRETGYLAEYLDVADFAKGLEWGLALPKDVASSIPLTLRCRQAAMKHHDPKLAVDRHLTVYARATERSAHMTPVTL